MYSYDSRIRYSEVDFDRNLTYFGLVNYMQDCSCFHSEEVGFGLDYLVPANLGWFVTGYEIHINRMPKYAEKIKISTYPYNFKGMLANRMYAIENESGELLAYANSMWILMNLETTKPSRIPEDMKEAYGQGPREDLVFEKRKLRPTEGQLKGSFTVNESYIDTNGHMNNSFYIDITNKFLPENMKLNSIIIEYRKAAQLKDELEVFVAALEDDAFQVILKKNDEVYTIVEYK